MPYGLILFAVYLLVAIVFSLRVPIRVKKPNDEGMESASPTVGVVVALLWPVVLILWVGAVIKGPPRP